MFEAGVALLVLVHGSPKPEANDPMFRVVERVRARGVYAIVEVGFMECNEPAIPEAIAACVAHGVRRIVAVPYFLHMGSHVASDLPDCLDEARARYPDVEFAMGGYLGEEPAVADVLADRAESALAREVTREA